MWYVLLAELEPPHTECFQSLQHIGVPVTAFRKSLSLEKKTFVNIWTSWPTVILVFRNYQQSKGVFREALASPWPPPHETSDLHSPNLKAL